jgi:hypothetical protein
VCVSHTHDTRVDSDTAYGRTSSAILLEFFIEPFPHEDTGTGTIGISEVQYLYRFWRYEFDASSNRILYRISGGFGGPVLEVWCLHVEGDSSSSPLAVISFSQRHERNATYIHNASPTHTFLTRLDFFGFLVTLKVQIQL